MFDFYVGDYQLGRVYEDDHYWRSEGRRRNITIIYQDQIEDCIYHKNPECDVLPELRKIVKDVSREDAYFWSGCNISELTGNWKIDSVVRRLYKNPLSSYSYVNVTAFFKTFALEEYNRMRK